MGADYIVEENTDVEIIITNGSMIRLTKIIIPASKFKSEDDRRLYIAITGAVRR